MPDALTAAYQPLILLGAHVQHVNRVQGAAAVRLSHVISRAGKSRTALQTAHCISPSTEPSTLRRPSRVRVTLERPARRHTVKSAWGDHPPTDVNGSPGYAGHICRISKVPIVTPDAAQSTGINSTLNRHTAGDGRCRERGQVRGVTCGVRPGVTGGAGRERRQAVLPGRMSGRLRCRRKE